MSNELKKKREVNNEPKWLKENRELAWQTYNSEPLPDRTSHCWRYSDPLWFDLDGKEISYGDSRNVQIFYDFDIESIKAGLVIGDLTKFINDENYNKLILQTFDKLVKERKNRIITLNSAIWFSGYFLYIPKGVKLEKPVFVRTINNETGRYTATRCLVILEEDTSLNLIDGISSNDKYSLHCNLVTEIFLGKNAQLNYLNMQTNGKETVQHLFQWAKLEDNAVLTNLIVTLGGKVSKFDLGVDLNKNNASTSIYGIVLGEGNQRFDHHTRVNHLAPYSRSDLNFRVVLKEKACSAYTGNLKIINEAIKSDAVQENRNLLLSSEARAESIPELEILTNDVIKCNHGVTVGQVDKDQMYYILSRGLDEKEAERIITEGFLEPTLSKIPEGVLKDEILLRIRTKLEG